MAQSVEQFAAKLHRAAAQAETQADKLRQEWGQDIADEMRQRVPVLTGTGRSSIRQTRPGEITMIFYLRYVDRGTSKMPPQEFVRPSTQAVQPRIASEALQAGVDWITGG